MKMAYSSWFNKTIQDTGPLLEEGTKQAASTIASNLPGKAGDAYSWYLITVGSDPITGKRLPDDERIILAAIATVVPIADKVAVGLFKKVAKYILDQPLEVTLIKSTSMTGEVRSIATASSTFQPLWYATASIAEGEDLIKIGIVRTQPSDVWPGIPSALREWVQNYKLPPLNYWE